MLAVACSSTPEKSTTGEAKTPEGAKPLDHEKCEDSMGRVEVLNERVPLVKRR